MTLFDESDAPERADESVPGRRMSRSTRIGAWSLVVATVLLLVLSFLPTAYVIQRPGPVFNTLGTSQNADGADVPLISIEGATTYPTAGALDLLTVQVVGDRSRTPSWFELATAWFDRSKAVVPIDAIFPAGQTAEQRSEQSTALMIDSQQEATAAALRHLGYDVPAVVQVGGVVPDSAADGVLQPHDIIRSVDGEPIAVATSVSDAVAASEGKPLVFEIERARETRTVEIQPEWSAADGRWLLGIRMQRGYDLPFPVTIQLNNVGGPSAGMMFALGIVDTLTPGELNGGRQIAGTGTIDAAGKVGPIGGIRQKLYGALDAGASSFLAPADNCGEVVGNVPAGLRVYSVATLDDALTAVETIAADGNVDALPTCTAAP